MSGKDAFERVFGEPQRLYNTDSFEIHDSISLVMKDLPPLSSEDRAKMDAVLQKMRSFVKQLPVTLPPEMRVLDRRRYRAGPPLQNIPMPRTEEGSRIRTIIHKSHIKLRSFFPGLNYAALEHRLIRKIACVNWTQQDYHWRDGEE
jgi:hypothetical protein